MRHYQALCECWHYTNKYIQVHADGIRSVCRRLVFDWHKRFREETVPLTDRERSGRPSLNDQQINEIREIVTRNRRITFVELSEVTWLSEGCVHNVLTKR